MTISTSRDFEFTVDQICTMALELANVTSPTQRPQPLQLAQARRWLQTILKELQDNGQFARGVTFIEITCVAGTYKYDLPTDTLKLTGGGMYIPAGTVDLSKAAGETLIEEQSREEWQRNSAKDSQGQPTLYFQNRAEVPNEVWLWPIPNEAGVCRFEQHVLIADVVNYGSATIDLKQFWMQYVQYRLAEMLAEGAGFDRKKISGLRDSAENYLSKARGRASQGINFQIRVAHGQQRRRY